MGHNSKFSKLMESLKSHNVEVVLTNNSEKELERFKGEGIEITKALSADPNTGLIFMGGFENKKNSGLAETHVIILSGEDIKEDVISAYRHAVSKSDCIFATSGPSKTADIEGKTIFGMHGPFRVVVILEVADEHLRSTEK